jgi:hypothetical protein
VKILSLTPKTLARGSPRSRGPDVHTFLANRPPASCSAGADRQDAPNSSTADQMGSARETLPLAWIVPTTEGVVPSFNCRECALLRCRHDSGGPSHAVSSAFHRQGHCERPTHWAQQYLSVAEAPRELRHSLCSAGRSGSALRRACLLQGCWQHPVRRPAARTGRKLLG